MNRGILYGIIAYSIWGLLPIYWKLLKHVPALEIMSQRVVWLLAVLAIILLVRKQWGWLAQLNNRRIILSSLAAAALLALNWFVYIWGVNAGFILETSLGYFINPLVNVVLGVVLLGERIRPGQWLAVGIAAAGVLYLTISYGSLPWISLTLAFSFGFYGLLKKRSSLGSLESLTLEATLMAPVALIFLATLAYNGEGALGHTDMFTYLLLIGTGIVTAVPLLSFGAAAKLIPLSVLGFLQYLAPTIQFMLGVFVYNETFTQTSLIGFSMIWLALIVFSFEGAYAYRRSPAPRPA
jgi:chloramphenicol-sensitive protein RarD